jgi:hypothetical protein
MNNPRVVRFSANDVKGNPVQFTVSNDIIDHMEAARTFGREDLADPNAHGRFQRRVIALPDRKSGVVAPMVLTIGNQNGLYLVRKDEKADSGWSLIDLSASFASAVGGAPQVRAVGAGWTDDDRISIAVAVDAGPGQTHSRVFVAYNLSSASSDWEHVAWTDCGTRESVRIEGIRVLDEGDNTWTVVLAGDKGPNEAIYLLRSGRAVSFAGAFVFNPAVTLEEILDFEIGVHPTYGGGLHVLGTGSGDRVLAFRPFPEYDSAGKPTTIPPIVGLPCPAGANVLETGATTENGSNVYIGGQGLQLIPAAELDNAEDAQVQQIVAPEAAANVQDVIVGEAADGSVSVWALLLNGDLNVVKRASADATWEPSLRLRSGVQEMAPVPGDRHATASILAVYADAHAGYIWQDNRTGVWQEAPLHVADPDQMMKVTCYGTSLRVLDDAGAPKIGVKVSVTTSILSSVSQNGGAVLIGPDAAVDTVTDLNGGVSLFNRVRSLTPAVYRFTVDGVAGHIDVNPASGVFDRFKSMTADELRSATVRTPNGDVPLLPDNFRSGPDQSQVDAVAASLNQAAGLAFSSVGAAPDVRTVPTNAPYSSALRADTLPDTYRWGIQADAQGVRSVHDDIMHKLIGAAESAERFFVNLGHSIADFFEGIGEKMKDGLIFVLHKADGAFQFVCAIGDKIKKFVLSTLEEAGAFFKWLWAQVETGLDKLWDFLKLLFDWEDIVLVRNAMVEATDEALASIKNSVGQMKSQVTAGFDKAIAQIGQWRTEAGVHPAKISRPGPGLSILDEISKVTAPLQKVLDEVSGNTVVGWVTQKIEKFADDIIHVEGPNIASEAMEAIEKFVEGLLSDEVNDLLATWDRLQTDISRLFDGAMPKPGEMNFETVKDALVMVGTDVLVGVLTGLRDFVLRTIDLMQSLIGVIRDALFAKVSFPFIEKLVELVAPGSHIDTSFRLVDCMMMLCAIPATITYKVMFREAPFKKGDVIPLAFGNVTVQSGAGIIDPHGLLRKFSYVAGFINMFASSIIAGYQSDLNALAKSPPSWLPWVGAGLAALGVSSEMLGRHVNKGEEVEAMEWTMLAVSSILSVKTFALLFAAQKKGDTEKLPKVNAALDGLGKGVHFILRTIVFGKVIYDVNKSNDSSAQDEKLLESLAWIESLFDHTGAILMAAAVLDKDPETKAILFAAGAAGRAYASGMNLVRVPITAQKNRLLTN